MSNRSEASILAGKRRSVVLAALVASALIFLMFAPGGVALANRLFWSRPTSWTGLGRVTAVGFTLFLQRTLMAPPLMCRWNSCR